MRATPRERHFKPYPAYKDSGVEWLGEIPAHWKVSRADAFLRYEKDQIEPSSILDELVFHYSIPSVQETGDGALEPPSEIDSAKLQIVGEKLLVSKLNPRKGVVLIASEKEIPTLCSTEFVPFQVQGCELKWALYLFLAESTRQRLSAVVRSATRSHQRAEIAEIVKIWHGVPTIPEQHAIAAFLDRETARIDALVAKKERLIELLQEQRTALITRAVTKGLDPTVPMKDSGVEWLGEIPAHWEVKRLKHTAPLQGGYAFRSDAFQSDGIPVVRMNNLRRGLLDLTEAARIAPSECTEAFALNEGDLLLGMSGSLGETGSLGNYAIVRSADLPCQLNQRVGRFRFSAKLHREFLLYFIAATPFTEPLIADSTGTAQFNISPEGVGEVELGLPSTTEQARIAAFLDRETARIDALVARVRDAIDRLKELRTALISAAVTGKIDVRGAALLDAPQVTQ